MEDVEFDVSLLVFDCNSKKTGTRENVTFSVSQLE